MRAEPFALLPAVEGAPAQVTWHRRTERRLSQSTESGPVDPPCIVLDTNVVLDWLYFGDLRCAALADAVAEGRVRWTASAPMRDELEHVLARGRLGTRWPDGPASVRGGWRRWATMIDVPAAPAPLALRCTDRDDQKFIDLALATRAVALLSADHAVLKLARRASAYGLAITTVASWRLA